MVAPGRVVVINGTSSAGKTTLAHAFQEARAAAGECWVVFGIDDFVPRLPRRWVAIDAWSGSLADEGVRLVRDGDRARYEIGALGRRLKSAYRRSIADVARAGLNVVVDDVTIERDEWDEWCEALAGLDPLTNVATALVGLGSVGLMALLAITALTIPLFFARQGMFGLGVTLAPAVGGLVIAAATVLAFMNYSVLTGVDSVVINRLPYVLIALAAFGACQARWLQRRNPDLYLRIASTRIDERAQVA